MFDFPEQPSALHLYLINKSEELQNIALLLGGRPWLGRVQRFMNRARNEASPSVRTLSELRQIGDLLRLEHVHDFERPEAAYFAELDLEAPYIYDICFLVEETDALVAELTGPAGTEEVL